MNGPEDFQGSIDNGRRTAPTTDVAALTEDELRSVDGEPLPNREAMSTLIWAPAPSAIAAPPVDEILGDQIA
jgi:hypothetical protein